MSSKSRGHTCARESASARLVAGATLLAALLQGCGFGTEQLAGVNNGTFGVMTATQAITAMASCTEVHWQANGNISTLFSTARFAFPNGRADQVNGLLFQQTVSLGSLFGRAVADREAGLASDARKFFLGINLNDGYRNVTAQMVRDAVSKMHLHCLGRLPTLQESEEMVALFDSLKAGQSNSNSGVLRDLLAALFAVVLGGPEFLAG